MPTLQQSLPHQPIVMPADVALPPQRRSTFFAIGSAMVKPFWTAVHLGERVTAAELFRAWLVHIVGMVVIVLVVLAMDVLNTWLMGDSEQTLFLSLAIEMFDELARFDWKDFFGIVVGILFFVFTFVSNEIGLMITPLLILTWTARAESFATAYLRTLKRIWLLTPMFVLPSLLVYAMALLYWLVLPQSDAKWISIDAWMPMTFLTAMTVGTLTVVVYLWALQVGHRGESCRWPALCEGCGYRLAGIDRSRGASCPECGLDVESSLTARGYRHETLGLGFLISPIRMGRSLLVHRNDEKPKLMFVLSMLLTVMTHTLAILLTFFIVNDFTMDDLDGEGLMVLAVCLYMSLATMATIAGLILFGTTIIGWLNRSTDGIAAHPAACAAMGYFSMYWPLVAVVQWAFVWTGIGLANIPWIEEVLGDRDGWFLVVVWMLWIYLGIPGVAMLLQFALTWLATRQARYANS